MAKQKEAAVDPIKLAADNIRKEIESTGEVTTCGKTGEELFQVMVKDFDSNMSNITKVLDAVKSHVLKDYPIVNGIMANNNMLHLVLKKKTAPKIN